MKIIYINKEFNVLKRKLIFISFVVKEEQLSDDLELIDKWLSDVLKIDLDVKNKLDSVIYDIVHRILLLSKTILQALRIPVFNAYEILEIKYDALNKQYHLRVAIDYIEYVTKKIYAEVTTKSALYISTYCTNNITTTSIQNLFQIMHIDIFKPYVNISGSGKSTIPILQVVFNQNIPFRHFAKGVYMLGWGSKSIWISRSKVSKDSLVGSQISSNKVHTTFLLQRAGLPAATHKLALQKEQSLAMAQSLGFPLVVKPTDRDRGEGVTVGIKDNKHFTEAFDIAKKASISGQVIIERQVDGVCHRIFIVNKKLLYVVKRLPKSVVSDGVNTIKELIEQANATEKSLPPWLKSEPYPMDEMALGVINSNGYTLDSVVDAGEFISLREIESTQWGGVDEDLSQKIHPQNLDIAIRAAELFNLEVAGVDIISTDITKPWYENGAIINEVNTSPLLGGNEFSKSKIPFYIKNIIDGDGRIPIRVIVGGNLAWDMAKKIQKKKIKNSIGCFITSHKETLNPEKQKIFFEFISLYERCQALLLNSNVDELILIVQTDEFLYAGLPVDKIDEVVIDSKNLVEYKDNDKKLTEHRYNALVKLLNLVGE